MPLPVIVLALATHSDDLASVSDWRCSGTCQLSAVCMDGGCKAVIGDALLLKGAGVRTRHVMLDRHSLFAPEMGFPVPIHGGKQVIALTYFF